ncbi:hypothetical protein [Botrimarina sp.]|uniref:hypothetical protein n=1 Tax=Botrimarina sp. TaxID=2795802 RepID=UPI0032EF0857
MPTPRRATRAAALWSLLLTSALSAPAFGHPIPTGAEVAQQDFTPATDEAVERSITELRQAMRRVADVTGGETARGAAWRTYLEWDHLDDRLSPAGLGEPHLWLRALRIASGPGPGFDSKEFAAYRDALRRLAALARVRSASDPHSAHAETLARLSAALGDAESVADHRRVRRAVAELAGTGQAATLRQQLQAAYADSNLIVVVPREALSSLSRTTVETHPVRMTVDGADVRGVATTTVRATLDAPPSASGVRLAVSLQGVSRSRTTAYRDGVATQNAGVFRYGSSAAVLLDANGLTVSPLTTSGQLDSQLLRVCSSRRGLRALFQRRIARRRQPIARYDAQRQSIAQADAAGEAWLHQTLQQARERVSAEVLRPLRARDVELAVNECRTTPTLVRLGCRVAAPGRLAVNGTLGARAIGDLPTLHVHESALTSVVAPAFVGRVAPLRVALKELFGGAGASAEPGGAPREVVATFDPDNPVEIQIDDDTLAVVLRLDRIEMSGSRYAGMELRLGYTISDSPSGVGLRAAPPEVLAAERADGTRPRLGIRDFALRRVLTNTAERDQPPSIDAQELLDRLWPDAGLSVAALRAGAGWLGVAVEAESLGAPGA